MNDYLELRFEKLDKEIKLFDFKRMIELEYNILCNTTYLVDKSVDLTPEDYKKQSLEKFQKLINESEIEKDFNETIILKNKVNSKKLKNKLKENLIISLNKIHLEISKPIEAISFQYNYEPILSILCWEEGQYKSNEKDQYLELGEINFYIDDVIDFNDWVNPVIYLEKKYKLFNDFELDSFFKLKNLYHLNMYLKLKDSLYEIFQKSKNLKSMFDKEAYFYINELDCEQTFLLRID